MKILFFSPYFHPYTSGITTIPLKICSYLSKKHTVTVLTFPHEKNLPHQEKFDAITVIRMPYLFKISKGYISPQSLSYFWKELQKHDTVILNIPNVEGVLLACLAFIMRKKVIALFNCLVTLPKSFFNSIIEWILNACIWIQLKLASKIITYTKDYLTHSWVKTLYKSHPSLVTFILPPIQLLPINKSFFTDLQNRKKDSTWIGFAGRIASEKGIEILIQALKKIQEESSIPNLHLIIAGPQQVAGEQHYFQTIKRQLESASLPYTLLGKLSDEDFGAFFKAIDILILPSINSTEAFGMVQAESMILGTPVISTDLPGVRVPIELTGMGKIVPIKDADALSKAITTILQHRSSYTNSTLVANAQRIFSLENTLTSFETSITT